MTNEAPLRALVCDIGRRLWQRGLIGGREGNLSVRLSDQRLLCTPKGTAKGHLRPDELIVVDRKGRPTGGGEASSELALHLRIYDARPDCAAIIHAHPPVATAMAVAGESIPDNVMPEAAMVLGSVPIVPFAMPGTGLAGEAIQPYLEDHKTFLLSHHGAVTLGRDLVDAWDRMEVLERIATVLLHAGQLGGAKPMPAEAFEQLLATSLNGRLDP